MHADTSKLLEQRLTSIETDQTVLSDEMTVMQSENESLGASLDNLERKHTKLDIRLTRIEGNNVALQDQVTGL